MKDAVLNHGRSFAKLQRIASFMAIGRLIEGRKKQ